MEPFEDGTVPSQTPWRSMIGSVPNALSMDQTTMSKPKPLYKQHTTLGFSDVQPTESLDYSRRFECSVCLVVYRESGDGVPRSLMCGHTFCTGCLARLVKNSVISCPKCHHPTPIPSHGVANGLVKNYGVLEIMCSSHHPTGEKEMEEEEGAPVSFNVEVPVCEEHGDTLSSFCVEDQTLVCSSCLLHGSHRDHPYKLIQEASMEYKHVLSKLAPDVKEKADELKAAIGNVENVMGKVQGSSMTLCSLINNHFDSLIKVLETRKKELKVEVMFRTQTRVEALLDHKHSLEKAIASAEDCHSTCNEVLSSSNHRLLQEYSEARRKILKVFTNPPSVMPVATDDLVVSFPPDIAEDFEEQFQKHGVISSDVGIVEHLSCDPFHDGIRVYWQGHNYVDSEGCTYALQTSSTENEDNFSIIYRGGETKYTYKRDDLRSDVKYRFRVRVQTTDGIGSWCPPIECVRSPPGWHWDEKKRNVKIELSIDRLEAWSNHSSGKYWSSVSGSKVFQRGDYYMELQILDLAKHHIHKSWFTKIALGVLQCSESSAKDIQWQDSKHPIGQFTSQSSLDHNSWGYIVTSGVKVSSITRTEEEYGGIPALVVGDRIGMLVSVSQHEPSSVSFFCNGNDLGVAYNNLSPPLIPVLSVCDKFHVRVRFPPPPYSKRNPRLTLLLTESSHSLIGY